MYAGEKKESIARMANANALTGTPQLHLVVQSLCCRAVPSQPFFLLEGSARNLKIPGNLGSVFSIFISNL